MFGSRKKLLSPGNGRFNFLIHERDEGRGGEGEGGRGRKEGRREITQTSIIEFIETWSENNNSAPMTYQLQTKPMVTGTMTRVCKNELWNPQVTSPQRQTQNRAGSSRE